MGFLAPLYIAGLLAIGLPILFHLIRRNPHGRQEFSSLMFLASSPPRLTKRSRLTNILLLILRSLAFLLLAFAFARPFFNQKPDQSPVNADGRRLAVMVDISASMRRGDLWKQVTAAVEKVMAEVTPADQVSLMLFDDHVRTAFSFEEWDQTDAAQRVALLKLRLAEAKPGWAGTKLGDCVATAADLVSELPTHVNGADEKKRGAIDKRKQEIVLISDLQEGGRPEGLQGHQWPANVDLEVRGVKATVAGNASVQWVKQGEQDEEKPDGKLRVRVSNEKDSVKEQFTLTWANEQGAVAGGEAMKVYVAPGHSQIVRVAWPTVTEAEVATQPAATQGMAAATAPAARLPVDRLVLTGDDADFDNTLFVVPPRKDVFRVIYIGDDAAGDVNDLRYYLESALAETPERKVEFVARGTKDELGENDLTGTRLVVVGGGASEEAVGRLKPYVEAGGDVLWVMKEAGEAKSVGAMMGMEGLEAKEVGSGGGNGGRGAGKDFALISRVDVGHPLFAPFADVRFGDFTKIHFWRHRRIALPEQEGAAGGVHVLAWFDDGSPFLMEKGMGRGWLRVATSGWGPADSQWALSTKFVPLMEEMLKRKDDVTMAAQYEVREAIALPAAGFSRGGVEGGAGSRVMIDPDGKRVELAGAATTFEGAEKPGIYRLRTGDGEKLLAVNLSADESRTAPVEGDFAQWGAKMGGEVKTAEKLAEEKRLRVAELENRQKVWRWLIVGVLGLLGLETLLAGRVVRRALKVEATT